MVDKLIGTPNTRLDVLSLPDDHRLAPRSISQHRLLISLIRWCLPLALAVLVITHESAVHVMTEIGLIHAENLFTEILVFGGIGPIALFGVITYIQRLLEAQWKTQAVLDELNRDLQRKVDERTAELEARNTELQQLDQMKSEFVALVSHELRAPLTTLHGGLELALQRSDHLLPEAQSTLEIMRAECERLTTFVQDILDLSRLNAGQLPIVLGPVALRPMLERSIQIIIGDRRSIEWDLPPGHPLVIVDEIHLEEAVRAVISNADKYSAQGLPLHIQVTIHQDKLQLRILDHGPGIPCAIQERIFDRFYRGSGKGEVQDHSGWGLGLYLARRLTEAQGGQLTLCSPVWPDPTAPGSVFTFILPLDVEGEGIHAGHSVD